jgi:predicted transcriptional regulator
MNLASQKIELAKRILDMEDEEMIHHIKAVIESGSEDWYINLPQEVKDSIAKGLAQSAKGETIPHKEVMKKYQKWLEK